MASKLYTEAIKREGIKLDKSALEKKDKQKKVLPTASIHL
jgi:hypothetical protein